jgi:hypothetical protein
MHSRLPFTRARARGEAVRVRLQAARPAPRVGASRRLRTRPRGQAVSVGPTWLTDGLRVRQVCPSAAARTSPGAAGDRVVAVYPCPGVDLDRTPVAVGMANVAERDECVGASQPLRHNRDKSGGVLGDKRMRSRKQIAGNRPVLPISDDGIARHPPPAKTLPSFCAPVVRTRRRSTLGSRTRAGVGEAVCVCVPSFARQRKFPVEFSSLLRR